jgi:hypothetical protein
MDPFTAVYFGLALTAFVGIVWIAVVAHFVRITGL